ncbi:hypothetical protein ACFVY4_02725 [Streptomyces sp. NPDC058299]|uniref:hypothetical protein n=1 Tax=Streptomyces sp. NPDC058299 TaxID=3346435 RepID=UPI0036E2FE72
MAAAERPAGRPGVRRVPGGLYAGAVFVSFLVGLLAMSRFARSEREPAPALVNGLAAMAVAVTLVVNLLRGRPVLSVMATLLIAAGRCVRWMPVGRPAHRHRGRGGPGRRGLTGSRRTDRK